MSGRRRTTLILVVVLVFAVGIPATVVKATWNFLNDENDSKSDVISTNVTEAKARGALVFELEPEPKELRVNGKTIRFHEAWLEERILRTHRLVWFPWQKRLGGYELCFTLEEGYDFDISEDWYFVSGESGSSFSSRWSREPTVYSEHLDQAGDVGSLRISLISSWEAPRPMNIRFLRK